MIFDGIIMHQTSHVANVALHDPDAFARNARGGITEAQAQAIRRMLVQSQTAIRYGAFGAIGLLFLVGFSLVSSGPLLSGAACNWICLVWGHCAAVLCAAVLARGRRRRPGAERNRRVISRHSALRALD
jgi:uncharacterized membrane protein